MDATDAPAADASMPTHTPVPAPTPATSTTAPTAAAGPPSAAPETSGGGSGGAGESKSGGDVAAAGTSTVVSFVVTNAGKYVAANKLAKFFDACGAKYVDINKSKTAVHGFVDFADQAQANAAMVALKGKRLKGKPLTLKPNTSGRGARGGGDGRKRRRDDRDGERAGQKPRVEDQGPRDVRDVVTPLWKLSYTEQVASKSKTMQENMRKLTSRIRSIMINRLVQLGHERNSARAKTEEMLGMPAEHDGMVCPFDAIVESPVQFAYRNKVAFSIGPDSKGETVVGFRAGSFHAAPHIESASPCNHIPAAAFAVAEVVQKFVRSSTLPAYSIASAEGCWRSVTVRTSMRLPDVMVIICAKDEGHDKTQFETEVNRLKEVLAADLPNVTLSARGLLKDDGDDAAAIDGKRADTEVEHPRVTSLLLSIYNGSSAPPPNHPMKVLAGEDSIREVLLGLTFHVSADAFFQVNSHSAERLYSLVREWTNPTEKDVVLDICCGTGTIGLAMASRCAKVIGVDMSVPGIENAKRNAETNGIANAQFICSKAEEAMKDLVERGRTGAGGKLIGIVDPPRGGLHPTVVRAIRTTKGLNHLIYVSCNPTGSFLQDAVNLCALPAKNTGGMQAGPRFRLVRARPLDLFPQTPHTELVAEFERVEEGI